MQFDRKEYFKKYRAEHREKLLEYSKKYYHEKQKNDPEYQEKHREASRRWWANHKEEVLLKQVRKSLESGGE